MKLTTSLLDDLTARAKASPRLRMNLDLRNSAEDGSIRESFIAAAGTSPNASSADCLGFSVPLSQWHNTECLESGTVFIECKDGAYAPLGPEDILG